MFRGKLLWTATRELGNGSNYKPNRKEARDVNQTNIHKALCGSERQGPARGCVCGHSGNRKLHWLSSGPGRRQEVDYDSDEIHIVHPPEPEIDTAFIGKIGDQWNVHVDGPGGVHRFGGFPSLAEANSAWQRFVEDLLEEWGFTLSESGHTHNWQKEGF
jgi:hypothetical protein